MEECLVDVRPSLVAHREPAVAGHPRQRALHHPPVCRPSRLLLSLPFLAMRLLMPRLRKAWRHFFAS
jgi:hypothetical protein